MSESTKHLSSALDGLYSSFTVLSDEEAEKRYKEEEESRFRRYFSRKIDEEFLEPIDRTRESVDWIAFDKIQSWDGKKGITARGPSQVGKTRAIYQAIMAEVKRSGKSFKVVDEFQLITKITDAGSDKKLSHLADMWIDEDILFFDDIDKVNFSQGVTGKNSLTLVFGVIKQRMSKHRPTILSYNLSIGEVFADAGPQVVNSLVERIKQKEHWMSVEFKKPKL